MVKVKKKTAMPNIGDEEQMEFPSLLGGVQNNTAPGRRVWPFLVKLDICHPYDTAIPLLDLYPRAMKTCVHKTAFTTMSTAGYFIIARNKEPLNVCSLVGGWKPEFLCII